MDDKTSAFLGSLWRGSGWGYYWAKNGKRSQWTPTAPIEDCIMGHADIYIGVHPGKVKRAIDERNRNIDIDAINCLFCEYDAKDELWAGSLANIRAYILTLPLQPSVIVASGGGYHCYWMTDEPFRIESEPARDYIIEIQSYWVTAMKGDEGARDLARILRLPATKNTKYDPARDVVFSRTNFDTRYKLADLCAIAEDEWRKMPVTPKPDPSSIGQIIPHSKQTDEDMIGNYNATVKIIDQLQHYGYTIDGDTFTRPNKDTKLGTSGTIDTKTNTAFTFSSNDPMYNGADLSKSRKGNGFDPFDMLCRIDFKNDKKAAVKFLYAQMKNYERTQQH